jgi:tRNA 2-thiouridine synthesizing protein A
MPADFGMMMNEHHAPRRIASQVWLAQSPRRTHVSGMSETLLDVKGMNCPLPVLKANRTLRSMAAGERLRVLATDRAAVADFQAFCRETGHALLAWSEEAGVFSFVIRRRTDDSEKKG